MAAAPHILYIENNEFNQRLTKKILEPAGFQVSPAFDGIEGIKKAEELLPDLILMDLDLPHLDGLGATAKIKSLPGLKQTPVVALASGAAKRDRQRALVAGCDGFIEKPIDAATFAEKIKSYLAGQREVTEPLDKDKILKDFQVKLIDQLRAKVEELEETNRELRASKEELQRAYEQSQRANEELAQLNKLKENIVATASHELRTPLSVAKGYLDILLEGLMGEVNDEQRHALGIADESLGQMESLIGKITDLTKLALKKIPLNLEELRLNESFQKVYDEFAFFMKIRELKLVTQLTDEALIVLADKDLLSQVFSNLLKNAICFTPNGGTITVSSWREGAKAYFRIADSGIGLETQDLERIFDEFYQVHDATHHKTGHFEYMTRGVGVGLAICRGLIQELGGKIWAESPGLDQGSSFTFFLPMVKRE